MKIIEEYEIVFINKSVVSNSFGNPIYLNGGQLVIDAFKRIYGVDIKKAGVLNSVYLQIKRIG